MILTSRGVLNVYYRTYARDYCDVAACFAQDFKRLEEIAWEGTTLNVIPSTHYFPIEPENCKEAQEKGFLLFDKDRPCVLVKEWKIEIETNSPHGWVEFLEQEMPGKFVLYSYVEDFKTDREPL